MYVCTYICLYNVLTPRPTCQSQISDVEGYFINMDKCIPTKKNVNVFLGLIHLVTPVPMHLACSRNPNVHNKEVNMT